MPKLSHYSKRGEVQMVDVSAKQVSTRTAKAHAFVKMKPRVVAAVRRLKKSQGQSPRNRPHRWNRRCQTHREWIPLCHPLPLTRIDVTATLCENGVELGSL